MQKGTEDGQEVAGEMQKQEKGLSPFPQHTIPISQHKSYFPTQVPVGNFPNTSL